LQAVFDGDKRAFESDIIMTKQTQQQKDHERDLLLAFWLAVHVENVELTHFMVKNEPLIKKLVTYLFLKQQHSIKRSSNLGSKSSSLYNGIIKPRANAYVGGGNRQFQKDLFVLDNSNKTQQQMEGSGCDTDQANRSLHVLAAEDERSD
jgi:hypothetical protein